MRASAAWGVVGALLACSPSTGDADPRSGSAGARSASLDSLLRAVDNRTIRFVTYWPKGVDRLHANRQVKVVGPPKAVELVERGSLDVIDRLVPLLDDRDRAWAAQVVLSAITGHEGDVVDTYGAVDDPAVAWWKIWGPRARENWSAWVDTNRGTWTRR